MPLWSPAHEDLLYVDRNVLETFAPNRFRCVIPEDVALPFVFFVVNGLEHSRRVRNLRKGRWSRKPLQGLRRSSGLSLLAFLLLLIGNEANIDRLTLC
jgi:hypothetical protein